MQNISLNPYKYIVWFLRNIAATKISEIASISPIAYKNLHDIKNAKFVGCLLCAVPFGYDEGMSTMYGKLVINGKCQFGCSDDLPALFRMTKWTLHSFYFIFGLASLEQEIIFPIPESPGFLSNNCNYFEVVKYHLFSMLQKHCFQEEQSEFLFEIVVIDFQV